MFTFFTLIYFYVAVPYVIRLQSIHEGKRRQEKSRRKKYKRKKHKYIPNMQRDSTTTISTRNKSGRISSTAELAMKLITGNSMQDDVDHEMIINAKHWSQVVKIPFGYEMFINHLVSEFSVENLLFITEVCCLQFARCYMYSIYIKLLDRLLLFVMLLCFFVWYKCSVCAGERCVKTNFW